MKDNKGLIILSLIFLFVLCFIDFTSAQTYKQGSIIDLKIPTNLTNCNLTIAYPNSSNLIFELPMSINQGYANYTLSSLTTIGTYQYYSECGSGEFEVTPTGFVGTLGFYIIILILSLGIIILGYGIEDAWVVVLGGFGLVLFGLFIYIYGIDGIKDTYYTYGISIITIMLGAYLGIRGALEQIGDIGEL